MEREQDKSPLGDIADFGSVSADTRGAPGAGDDEIGGQRLTGLSDD